MRDYIAEMRTLIDHEADGEYVSGLVASDIVEKLRVNDPELLTGWLDVQAVALVHAAINERDRSRRSYARTAGPRSVFAQAAEAAEQGRPEQMATLLNTVYVVNGEDLRKPLASMGSRDLEFVSKEYRKRAASATLEAAFFGALARKVGNGTVADHFSESQLKAMRESLCD